MARLCDPDINMIMLPGCSSPEPSIRHMVYHYYDSHGMGSQKSKLLTEQYLAEQDAICQKSITPKEGE